MHTLSKHQQLYCYQTSGAKFAASRLRLLRETSLYVHTVLAFRLPWVTRLLRKNFCIFCSVLITVVGVSQPSSNVTRKV